MNSNNRNTLIHYSGKVWLTRPNTTISERRPQGINVCIMTEDGNFASVDYLTLDVQGVYHRQKVALGTIDSESLKQYIDKMTGSIAPQDNDLFDLVCQAYEQNKNMKKTAKEIGISSGRVKRILITRGLYTCEMHEKIIQMVKSGQSLSEIAATLDMSVETVREYMPYDYEESIRT